MRKFCYLLLLLGLVMTQSVKADKTAKAIWTADNTTLTFVYDEATYNVGDAYGTGTVTNVWDPTVLTTPDIDTETWETFSGVQIPGWIEYDPVYSGTGTAGVDFAYNSYNPFKTKISNVTKVVFDASFAGARPTSLALWFFICNKLSDFEGLEYLNTSSATDMRDLFYHCDVISSAELDLTHFETSNVTNMMSLFTGCAGLTSLNLSSFKFDNVTDMRSFVQSCNNLYEITFPTGVNTGNVTDMESMFRGCAFETLSLPEGFATSKVTTMKSMFRDNTKLKTLTLPSSFATKNVENMNYMFGGCPELTALDLSMFNTDNVNNMGYMFASCSKLTDLDLSSFNTLNVTTMAYMFQNCSKLKNLVLSFNTPSLLAINDMFSGCSELTALNLSGLNTSKVSNMNRVFNGCATLTNLDLSGFNTSNATSMVGIFNECTNLETITFTKDFITSKVTTMQNMFRYCGSLKTLDLSMFNTSNVKNMIRMFSAATNLENIAVSDGWNTDAVTESESMFLSCSSLVGGNGTAYNKTNPRDKSYAHVDEEGNPGYLTLVPGVHQFDITSAGMATLCYGEDLMVPEGVEAWYCRSISDESSIVLAYPLTVIPANTGVFLTTNDGKGKSILFEKTTGTPAITNNIMVGVLEDTAVDPKSVLTLGHDQDGKLGFWYFSGTTIPAGRAYIPKSAVSTDAAAEARAYTVVFDESGESQTTGINNVNVNHNVDCYDLLGRRVAQPQKGLYIVNGKKVVIK